MPDTKEVYIYFTLTDGTIIKGDDVVAETVNSASNDDMLDSGIVFDMVDLLTNERIIFPFTSVLHCKFIEKDQS